ncbi:MAG: hypothetical protein RMK29_22010 [Myxococcales bacterium]|nr:CRISPR-associated protein Csm7 [Myxococcota bacterium]MDW8284390.1 hypothetical protein [Myxococcales bacterium]
MIQLLLRLRPLTAFATPLQGDTLFGQLCWAVRNGWGEARLAELLAGYTDGHPFVVVSDAFPAGYLPLPHLPARLWAGDPGDPKARKALKKIAWVPHDVLARPLAQWRQASAGRQPGAAGPDGHGSAWLQVLPQPRNSLDRLTFCTAEGDGFSPYTVHQFWFAEGARLELHVRLDETRLSRADLRAALASVGRTGYGKDASVGLGKFEVEDMADSTLHGHDPADAWLALAPCAPQGLGYDPARSFYKPFTRYGRHGDVAVHYGNPFKSPILLTAAGAVFAPCGPEAFDRGFVGQGLGGEGRLSRVLRETVHQGYAPALPIRLPEELP